jgi:hypothetical protein
LENFGTFVCSIVLENWGRVQISGSGGPEQDRRRPYQEPQGGISGTVKISLLKVSLLQISGASYEEHFAKDEDIN